MAGSTKVTAGSVTFFKRPPSVSFASSPLDAFVVMNNGMVELDKSGKAHQFSMLTLKPR